MNAAMRIPYAGLNRHFRSYSLRCLLDYLKFDMSFNSHLQLPNSCRAPESAGDVPLIIEELSQSHRRMPSSHAFKMPGLASSVAKYSSISFSYNSSRSDSFRFEPRGI